jgi:hypothetical protein
VAAAAVLLGALVLAGRLLDADPGPAATRATRAAAPTTTPPVDAVAVEGVAMVPTSRAFRGQLRWSDRGTFVTVAPRGPSEGNQRLAVALAGRVRLVPPRDRPGPASG